mmetsp:Transcript_9256/g.22716  ORF Transcript_9256/g.22716 Transcript_9256/m.22716 type:complete len:246 (-) Transcript_9256:130-867(-)|eukprot:CAMPEP_0197175884 /NCGR_PEP_ID=MMETSP1423-20130617/1976_1 /TAXON_ID=476441 /ORGANISM="Pseudo-nitzschia heimii, Strain UNC1101" /LENGTH=245 /DNA_ID=CAMNT_0042625133 /DNA_START=96 /DNA_END=833 /DNA_ORIENTATION=-
MVTITPVDENDKDVFSIESLIGPKLLKEVKGTPVSTTKNALKTDDTSIVALYFSAAWCPPCQRFTPILTEFYNAAKEAKSGFEIVFVSSDTSQEEFEKYYGKMPWLSMPMANAAEIKNKLAQTLHVTSIPSLAVIDLKTGELISGGEARDDVMAAGGDKDKVAATIAKWKAAERHPMEAASKLMNVGAAARNPLFGFLSFLAKNPMFIFGLLYVYKWVKRKMDDTENDDENFEVPPELDEQDSEF